MSALPPLPHDFVGNNTNSCYVCRRPMIDHIDFSGLFGQVYTQAPESESESVKMDADIQLSQLIEGLACLQWDWKSFVEQNKDGAAGLMAIGLIKAQDDLRNLLNRLEL